MLFGAVPAHIVASSAERMGGPVGIGELVEKALKVSGLPGLNLNIDRRYPVAFRLFTKPDNPLLIQQFYGHCISDRASAEAGLGALDVKCAPL